MTPEQKAQELESLIAEEWEENSDSESELEELEREYEPDPDDYYDRQWEFNNFPD